MTVMQEDNVNGLICPKCGWNIVTTKIDDIMLDTQLYQLYILKKYFLYIVPCALPHMILFFFANP